MADFNSSLPVRTENAGDVIAKIADATTPSQQLGVDSSGRIVVKLDDGSGNIITSQVNGAQRALDVGINVAGVQIDPRQIRALTSADVVSVVQSTSPWITSDLADGSVAGGTAGTKSMLAGLIYNSAAPTLTTGQQASLQGDVSGNLKVNIAAGSLDVGVADKTAFTYGTSIFQPVGGVFQDTAPTLTAGTSGAARLTTNRGLHVNLRDSSGNEKLAQQTSALSIPVVIASDQSTLAVKDLADGSATGGTAGTFSLLAGAIYNSTLPTLTTGQQASLQLDSSGRLIVDLGTALPAGTNTIGTVNQGTANTISNAWPVKLTDGTSTVAVAPASTAATATQAAEVVALSPNSPLPAGTNALGSVLANIQVAGAAVSSTNPVPVTVTTTQPGTAIQAYNTSAALAAGSSVTFTYTVVAAHTFNLERVWASASGKIKCVVQNGATTIFVGFNSTANPNIDMTVVAPPTIAAAGTVNVIITNDDKQPFDVYATIEGNQN